MALAGRRRRQRGVHGADRLPDLAIVKPAALIPGDALVRDDTGNPSDSTKHHIVLFVGWGSADGGAHRCANIQQESTFGVGTIAADNQDLSDGYWGLFTPIHYVNMVVPSAPRVGVLTTDDHALFKEGSLSASWATEGGGGVKQIALDGDRVGVLNTADQAYVKEGGLSTVWVHEHDGVGQIALS